MILLFLYFAQAQYSDIDNRNEETFERLRDWIKKNDGIVNKRVLVKRTPYGQNQWGLFLGPYNIIINSSKSYHI